MDRPSLEDMLDTEELQEFLKRPGEYDESEEEFLADQQLQRMQLLLDIDETESTLADCLLEEKPDRRELERLERRLKFLKGELCTLDHPMETEEEETEKEQDEDAVDDDEDGGKDEEVENREDEELDEDEMLLNIYPYYHISEFDPRQFQQLVDEQSAGEQSADDLQRALERLEWVRKELDSVHDLVVEWAALLERTRERATELERSEPAEIALKRAAKLERVHNQGLKRAALLEWLHERAVEAVRAAELK